MYELPKKKQHFKAFTLIEILVSISIMAILFSIGVANFRGAQRSKSLDAFRNQVISDLRRAQQYAQGGMKPSGCNGVLENVDFRVITTTSYQITANCLLDDGTLSSVPIKDIILDSVYRINAGGSVEFKPVGGGVENPRVITVTNTITGDSQSINISQAGDIR